MKQPHISPRKLLKFLRKVQGNLEELNEALDKVPDVPDSIDLLVAGLLEDVGDQLVFLPRELKPKRKK